MPKNDRGFEKIKSDPFENTTLEKMIRMSIYL